MNLKSPIDHSGMLCIFNAEFFKGLLVKMYKSKLHFQYTCFCNFSEVNEIRREILLVATTFFLVAVLAIPMVSGLSWEPKNNEKFQSFETTLTAGVTNVEIKYSPSEDEPNKVVISADESMSNYQIIIDGSKTYIQDVDFVYNGHLTWMLFDPELPLALPYYLTPARMLSLDVRYSYTFLPASGIEGTINMHAIAKGETIADLFAPGEMLITSLEGTGDLQNVNIKATAAVGGHMGIVSGWPE